MITFVPGPIDKEFEIFDVGEIVVNTDSISIRSIPNYLINEVRTV